MFNLPIFKHGTETFKFKWRADYGSLNDSIIVAAMSDMGRDPIEITIQNVNMLNGGTVYTLVVEKLRNILMNGVEPVEAEIVEPTPDEFTELLIEANRILGKLLALKGIPNA